MFVKIKAISKYKSQSERPYMNKGFITHWAEINGMKIGVKYAEAFEAIRIVR